MNSLNKKTIEDIDVSGKRVLVRCDFNVPLKDGVITNDKRIVAALPTIQYLIGHQAKVILCSHLGRPKGEYKEEFSLAPVAARLSELLGQPVELAQDKKKPNTKSPSRRSLPVWLTSMSTMHLVPHTAHTAPPPALLPSCQLSAVI